VKTAIYPGTFDPITLGHLEIARRGMKLVDKLIIAVADVPHKRPTFTCALRMDMARSSLAEAGLDLEVDSFNGLLVNYARSRGAGIIIRGLRAVSDFEYEFQMALMNREIGPEVEEVFLTSDQQFIFLSSSMVREVASLGGDISQFVTPSVQKIMRAHYSSG
jgi:pantetheine-phosphate adenylyltransferase